MAVQKSKDLLLKIKDNSGTFVFVGGLRSRQMSFNASSIDVTHSESTGLWRFLLQGAGLQSCSLTGTGVFKNEASDLLLQQTFFACMIREYQITIPNLGMVQGFFQLVALRYLGEFEGDIIFDISLESAGVLTFTGE